ncbi:LLGL2 protein, partial [Cooperia oncophora]
NITWTRDGSRFVLALQDGSYASCDPSNASTCERPPQVFGPFPCVPTKKAFFAETSSSDERIVLFSGGMPHASYGDRFVVTARQDDGYHTCALVLTENELVCIDLTDRYWRVIPTEQIFPLHASQ